MLNYTNQVQRFDYIPKGAIRKFLQFSNNSTGENDKSGVYDDSEDLYKELHKKSPSADRDLRNKHLLDGCYHVFLDLGSNRGIQTRKLFEPDKYPKSRFQKIFTKYYGSVELRGEVQRSLGTNGNYICAVGFEPNSHHSEYLMATQTSHNKCGWRTKFFTETGVSDKNDVARFFSDNDKANFEWGGGVLPPDVITIAKINPVQEYRNVTVVRLSEFINNIVGGRHMANMDCYKDNIPTGGSAVPPPKVVMKMDIEGSEVEVVPDLIFMGSLQFINILVVEWHPRLQRVKWRAEMSRRLTNVTKILSEYLENVPLNKRNFDFTLENLDDETYHKDMSPLPLC